jgi:hypothetical protein
MPQFRDINDQIYMSLIPVLILSLILVWLLILTFVLVKISNRPARENIVTSSKGFRMGLVKFSPFEDTGGDQSFVISLLDGGGSGILVTSLHARGVTRLYAKKVTIGKNDASLSLEEKEALRKAVES